MYEFSEIYNLGISFFFLYNLYTVTIAFGKFYIH